jgi:nitroimidazol reductase NimA-like FMN-containing flavoprotein (pyridoxamine 5'-phosphate oxidase superfamily)
VNGSEEAVTGEERAEAGTIPSRQAVELTWTESWELLAGAPLGRIVFTERAMPAVRPVNHLVDDEAIILRSNMAAAIVGRAREGAVVCFEADDIDPVRHTGWSVIVTGMARLVLDPVAVRRYQQLLKPWAEGEMDQVIVVTPQIVTGLRLVGWCR